MSNLTLWKKTLISTALLAPLATNAVTYQAENLKEFMEEFHANPAKVMDETPIKYFPQDVDASSVIPESATYENDFVEVKDSVRKNICTFDVETQTEVCAGDLNGRSGIQRNDLTETLIDLGRNHIKTLATMDKRGLQKAKLSVRPWSDDYWSIANGVLGYRYADPEKAYGSDWQEVTDYVREKPADLFIESGAINLLSPAEKYDLLVGDSSYSLTNAMLNEGKPYYERSGEVESWMGICHGWAAAAFMMDRPTRVVNVIAADGETMIPFYPSDIKSLGSLLWAKKSSRTKFSGGRCNEKDPNKDKESGRITDQQCFDTNPGTWHKSVVNQIGVSDRSFIIDATYDYEVWNQPVYSYNYKYFNLETYETSKDYKDVVLSLKDYKKDKFKKYRSSQATKVVGVEMTVEYIAETRPSHRTYDSESHDYVATVKYRYDLELNSRGSIVGGEWYSNKHPDFLWVPVEGGRGMTNLDNQIVKLIEQGRTDLEWKAGQAVPSIWSQYVKSFSKQGVPLGLVVEGLIERSNNQ